MHKILTSHHPVRHLKSLKYALQGIQHVILNEANFRVRFTLVIVLTILGFYLGLSPMEWGLLALGGGMLLSAEVLNTIVEEFIDHLIKEHHEGARVIKDMSAGFVLITALTLLFIIILIFGHNITEYLLF